MYNTVMSKRKNLYRYSVLCALEELPAAYPATLKGGIEDVARRAAAAGASAMELHIRDPEKYDGNELAYAAMNNSLSFSVISTGLEYVLNRLILIDDDPKIRNAAVKRLKEHIDLAEMIECGGVVIGMMRGSIPDFAKYEKYEGRLTEAVLELSDYAAGKQVVLLIEGINRYVTNYLCGVPETLTYVRKLDRQNIMIHIDTHQMNIEDSDFAEAIRMCGEKLGYVHLSDNNRACPGGGNIDFLPVLRALSEISFKGFLGLESVECPPGSEALKTSIEMLRGLEGEI